jgi:hypothetical protein
MGDNRFGFLVSNILSIYQFDNASLVEAKVEKSTEVTSFLDDIRCVRSVSVYFGDYK